MPTQVDNPQIYVWFEENQAATWFCLEFFGGYQPNAAWYMPFWQRLRIELGAKNHKSSEGWDKNRGGGIKGNVWRLNLASESLKEKVDREKAIAAIHAAVDQFNSPPHDNKIILSWR